jgi:uncharacterized protein (DUF1684 family)
MKRNIYLILLLGFLFSCQTDSHNEEYLKEMEEWRSNRLASLTKADGWTTLIGLHWLQEGEQTFGSAEDNDIVFPEKTPDYIGSFNLTKDSLSVQVKASVDILINGENLESSTLYSDVEENTSYLNWESFTWYIIKRGDKYGIRIKDSLSSGRFALTEIPHYPVDEKWKVSATLQPVVEGTSIEIENILGQISDNPLEGNLEFTFGNKLYQLAALNGGAGHYFVIIADETTGEDTYGGGRYIYVDRIDSTGQTFIDFNMAYNPPCVFSPHATCPLPPKENYLPFAVKAGEKELEGH